MDVKYTTSPVDVDLSDRAVIQHFNGSIAKDICDMGRSSFCFMVLMLRYYVAEANKNGQGTYHFVQHPELGD
jgi:hypothetical protein